MRTLYEKIQIIVKKQLSVYILYVKYYYYYFYKIIYKDTEWLFLDPLIIPRKKNGRIRK